MATIIDRRNDGGDESAPNRRRFMERHKKQIREAVKERIRDISIQDLTDGDYIDISISGDMSEPTFEHRPGTGERDQVHPGNKGLVVGDTIPKPPSGSGQNGTKGGTGESEDEFRFKVTNKEYMKIIFEDMELPDMEKRQAVKTKSSKFQKLGYVSSGAPSNINVKETFKKSIGRRLALRSVYKSKLEKAKEAGDQELIEKYEKKLKTVPFLEDIDVKYDFITSVPELKYNAVMFCMMDVSASMGEYEKDLAKRFYILLYLFLRQIYTDIDIVFIRHTDTAREVSEQKFFYSRESGGTVMSSGLELINSIIGARYPKELWNIYVAQCTDGDNFDYDNPNFEHVLKKTILPSVQHYFYTEILGEYKAEYYKTVKEALDNSPIWKLMNTLKGSYKKIITGAIGSPTDLWPVFKSLFKKRG